MKKVIIKLLILTFLFFPLISKAVVANSFNDYTTIYFFYDENCEECDEANKWLNKEIKENDDLRVEDIKIDDNVKLNTEIRKNLNIKNDKNPLIIIGSHYFVGFNNTIKNNLTNAIKAYEEAQNFCDVVKTIQNNKDLNKCLSQNENIYKSQIDFSVIEKILLIISGLCLFIMGAIIIKKYKNSK